MTDDEKDRALCEAHCNSAADEYFNARPQLDSNVNRRIFYAGHRKAWIERSEAVRLNAHGVPDGLKEKLTDLLADGLRETWHCNRVWKAWHVGTMSEDDFEPVEESDTPAELADAVIAMLSAAPAAPQPAQPLTDEQIKDIHWSKPMDEFQFARAIEQAHGIGVKND